MENPLITFQHEHIVITSKAHKQLRLHVSHYLQTPAHLLCQFAENENNLFAAVFATSHDTPQLARRATSFIRAYLFIADVGAMETAVLQAIDASLRNRPRS